MLVRQAKGVLLWWISFLTLVCLKKGVRSFFCIRKYAHVVAKHALFCSPYLRHRVGWIKRRATSVPDLELAANRPTHDVALRHASNAHDRTGVPSEHLALLKGLRIPHPKPAIPRRTDGTVTVLLVEVKGNAAHTVRVAFERAPQPGEQSAL